MDASVAAGEVLREARRLLVLTGAGLSTESGIPDFRSAGGIWTRFDPSDFAYERFLADPRGFWELRARLMEVLDLASAKPNPAHDALASASRSPRLLGHVTQNIDGLLQAAGHVEESLVEIHGSARRVRCVGCARFFPYEAVSLDVLPPRCPACGGVVKPGTILFGEPLHEPDLRRAQRMALDCDAMLVVGSSLQVYPAAALPRLAIERGAHLVIVDQGPTPHDVDADALVRGRAGDVVPALLRTAGLL